MLHFMNCSFDNYYYVFYRLKDNYNYDKLMDTTYLQVYMKLLFKKF